MKEEILDLDEGEGFTEFTENLGWRVKEGEKRVSLYHKVVHTLAFIIVCPYVVMVPLSILLNFEIPVAYSTMVSIVIGFYFAKALF